VHLADEVVHAAERVGVGVHDELHAVVERRERRVGDDAGDLHDHVGLEKGTFKATPVWWAVAHGDNLPLVKMLLKRGARADNCLWAVVWNDNADMLREILKTKPPIDDVQGGETVIISAVRWRKLKTLDMLLDAGADTSFRDAKGRDALFHARRKKLPSSLLSRLQRTRDGIDNTSA